MVLATPRYAATSSGKGRTSPGFGLSRGLRSRHGRSTKFEDVLRAAVPRPAEPTDRLRLVDVHGSVGQHRVVHVESDGFAEEDRVVRDRDARTRRHSKFTGDSAIRGGLTASEGTGVRPASSNSLIWGA